MRHMGIAEQRDAVRAEDAGTLQAVEQIVAALPRQPVHQVEVERAHARLAQQVGGAQDHVLVLQAADTALAMRGKGLDAQAGALDADAFDYHRPFARHGARVQLNRPDRVGQAEADRQRIDEADEIGRRDGVGTAAAERYAPDTRTRWQ